MFSTAELTFPLVGLLVGAWVCVALETLQTLPLASGTGLRAPSVTAASSLGRFSAAVQGGNSLDMRSPQRSALSLPLDSARHLQWRTSRRLVGG